MQGTKNLFIETYGCQMNIADSEIVASVLKEKNCVLTKKIEDADVILINTCSIRENAEQRIRGRVDVFRQLKKKRPSLIVGIIGCMAERLQEKLLDKTKIVDIVAGPDSYRNLPTLLEEAEKGQQSIDTELSLTETYHGICPERLDNSRISAFVAIMRGCNNFCSYCIVPYTRGRERSRSANDIINEVENLIEKGYKEVTLLGQNVNSYKWSDNDGNKEITFPELLEKVALLNPELRVRFTTSHPKDLSDELLYTIVRNKNICRYIHLPVQSGSSRILKLMNRKYTRDWYMDRIEAIRKIVPNCGLSTDVFTGFCSETEEEHKETLSLMEWAKFDLAYMFKYSERPGTFAHKNLDDNISEELKTERLQEVIALQQRLSAESNERDLGQVFEVLVEGTSKRSTEHLFGRSSQNKVVVFPRKNYNTGDYVNVKITKCTSATLIGEAVE